MAFVEKKPGAPATEHELIDHCRKLIASYKKPKSIRFVDALPRTGTGKVMKGELRKRAAALVGAPQ
jgi:acyl-CoA synthetase (AMP-forming)/AMP-acid ligase II